MPVRRSRKTGRKVHRKHTPIRSQRQRALFGAELARRRAGKARRMKSITTKELEGHLRESRGKKLPKTIPRGRRRKRR